MEKNQIIHIAGECIVLLAVVSYFNRQTTKLTNAIVASNEKNLELESRCRLLENNLHVMEGKFNQLVDALLPVISGPRQFALPTTEGDAGSQQVFSSQQFPQQVPQQFPQQIPQQQPLLIQDTFSSQQPGALVLQQVPQQQMPQQVPQQQMPQQQVSQQQVPHQQMLQQQVPQQPQVPQQQIPHQQMPQQQVPQQPVRQQTPPVTAQPQYAQYVSRPITTTTPAPQSSTAQSSVPQSSTAQNTPQQQPPRQAQVTMTPQQYQQFQQYQRFMQMQAQSQMTAQSQQYHQQQAQPQRTMAELHKQVIPPPTTAATTAVVQAPSGATVVEEIVYDPKELDRELQKELSELSEQKNSNVPSQREPVIDTPRLEEEDDRKSAAPDIESRVAESKESPSSGKSGTGGKSSDLVFVDLGLVRGGTKARK